MSVLLFKAPVCHLEYYFQPSNRLPFGSFLIFVENGLARIKQVYSTNQNQEYIAYLYVNDIPIVEWQSENDCPTCDQLLKSGNPDFHSTDLASIFSASLDYIKAHPHTWWESMVPLLKTLESGIYLIAYNAYYPSNDDHRLFWEPEHSQMIKNCFWGSDGFCFLTATQSVAKFNVQRFQQAKSLYKSHPGIAYYLTSRVSLLLDGHHRALAAALADDIFNCITIDKVSWSWQGGDTSTLPNEIITETAENLATEKLSPAAQEWLLKKIQSKPVPIKTCETSFQAQGVLSPEAKAIFEQAAADAKNYPSGLDLNIVFETGDISDEAFAEILDKPYAEPYLSNILLSLIITKDSRAKVLAYRISKDETYQVHWKQALNYLALFTDKEILDLFLDLAINDNYGRKEISATVNAYLSKHAALYD